MNFSKTRDIASDIFKMIRQMYENQTVSTLEKDLLKEKLRRLYEAVDEMSSPHEKEVEISVTDVPAIVFPESAEVQEIHNLPNEQAVLDFTTTRQETIQTPTVQEPLVQAKEAESKPINKDVEVVNVTPEAPHVDIPVIMEQKVAEAPLQTQQKVTPIADDDLEDLFVFTEAKELLEKLRQSPIADIQKALTLNEKLQYAKALFNNDTEKMNLLLTKLNQLSTFDQAKSVLISEVVFTYKWMEKDKKKLAKELIQLVKRRYTTL